MLQRRMTAGKVVLIGMAGLASAMGIGRFAFTPALPLMQAEGLDLVAGSWLASANYLGYLLGSLLCLWLPKQPAAWARSGLLLVAVTTLLMGASDSFMWWLTWRLLAGIGSALVLVGLSAWCLAQLVESGRGKLAGVFYAGVGSGLVVAGLAGLIAGLAAWHSNWLWGALGSMALLVWWCVRADLRGEVEQAPVAVPLGREKVMRHAGLLVCYASLGVGYILPATFLPALARLQLGDPALFGWVWPVFGITGAISTLVAAPLVTRFTPRRVWAVANLVMAVGVGLPVLFTGLPVLLVSAFCVGGTFMVITMAGLQEARALGGARLIAGMTASFAVGQMAGPLLVGWAAGDLRWPGIGGVVFLLLASFYLVSRRPRTASSVP